MVHPAPGVTRDTAHPPRIFISAGEVSGDIVAARLIDALRAVDPAVTVTGIGGPHMSKAGAALMASADHLGVIGVSEALRTMPSAVGVFRAVVRHCRAHRPDVAVLIANDIFNVLLGRRLRAHGITTVALFPPQTWIWGAIARLIAPSYDRILATFPEEADCYARAGASTSFVGHYLADILATATPADRAVARDALGLPRTAPVVAILPGSRRHEIDQLLPELLAAADLMIHDQPDVRVLAAINTADRAEGTIHTPGGHSIALSRDSHMMMRAADVLLMCSGTATLEASLIGTPMVVAYRTSWITYRIVRAAIRAGLMPGDTMALPNLLLDRPVVPEFQQHRLTASALASAATALLSDEQRRNVMREDLREVRARVEGPGSLARAADIILNRSVR